MMILFFLAWWESVWELCAGVIFMIWCLMLY